MGKHKSYHRLDIKDQIAVKKLMESQRQKIEAEAIRESSKCAVLAAIMALVDVVDVDDTQVEQFINKFFLQFDCICEGLVSFEDIEKQIEIEIGLKIQLEE